MNRRKKGIAVLTAAMGVVVLVGAGFAAKDRIREEWNLYVLKTGEQNGREATAEVLGELKSICAVPVLAEFLRRESRVKSSLVQRDGKHKYLEIHYAAASLEKIGAPALPELNHCLDHPSPLVKVQAASVIYRMGPDACGPIFSRAKALMDSGQLRDEISQAMDSTQ